VTTIFLAGGGTGGHVFPLIAMAEAIGRVAPELAVRFVGSERGIESRVVPARGYPLDVLPSAPLKGGDVFSKIRGGMIASAGVVAAGALLAKHRPKLVISVGGFAAGPVSIAAAAVRIPVVLIEPNRISGMTQKLLGPIAKRIYVGFPEMVDELGARARFFGVPLRDGFSRVAPRLRGDRPLEVLVFGGSQGAAHLNETMPQAVALAARGSSLRVLHQAGRDRDVEVRSRYAAAIGARSNVQVEVAPFLDDMPSRLAAADVVVCRSGALSCAELCMVGRPSIMIPYPHAADDHQAKNAFAMRDAGAAFAMRQADASAEAIAEALRTLARDDHTRVEMAQRAAERGVPNAALHIANDALGLAGLLPASARAPSPNEAEKA
jgi:UDP-N-acetylglucosamine--N-acetylmuramyl-(pentapeptide) pyrophosphoryl-undecaprenol N-acetylglucosamine transferase